MSKKKKEIEQAPVEEIPWHNMEMSEVLSTLDSYPTGLKDDQIEGKLLECGPNRIVIEEKFKILKMLGEQFTDFLVILLIVAGFISLGLGIWKKITEGHGEEIIDAIAIFTIVIINAVIGFVQDFRSNQALEKLKEYFEQEVLVIRGGEEKIINSCDLVPGDLIVLEMGDKVPADARIIEANNFKVDEAPLTGESKSITKTADLTPEKSRLHERKNMVYMGTTVVYGRAKLIIVTTGMNTEMGKIAILTQEKKELTPIQQALDRLGKVLGAIILGICGLVMVIDIIEFAVIQKIDPLDAFIESFETAIALAISAVPEGLPAAIVITLAIGVSRMAKRKTIVSRLPAVETLGSVNYICSDKTGTLTRNEMTVRQMWTTDGITQIGGSGYLLEGDFTREGKKIDPKEDKILSELLHATYHCNNSAVLRNGDKLSVKGDPTEAALVVAAEKAGLSEEQKHEQIHEIFFDSERKRMTTIHDVDGKYVAYMKGSPPTVLARCDTILQNGKTVKITKEIQQQIEDANMDMATEALRVLAVAYKEVPKDFDKEDDQAVESEMIFVGLTGMIDPPRLTVKQAIDECREAGITTVMITGDQKATAVAVAKEIGIMESDDLVINGDEFSTLTDEELLDQVEQIKVFSRMSPKDKYRVVETLQKLEHRVACTGDGVNDAPAIQKADIGVAMGITGTDVTKEVADMVITDDAFDTIVSAVEEGRNIFENMKKFIRYTLSCNFDEIFAVLIVTVSYGVLPFLPLQILFLNLLTDALPSLSLAFDPYDPELMKRPPRGKQSSFVRDMYVFAVVAGFVALACSIGIFYVSYLIIGPNLFPGNDTRILAYAQMMAYVATLSFELWFVFIARNDNDTSLIKSHPFKNKYLIGAVIISWILLIGSVHIPVFQGIFTGFETFYQVTWMDWGIILAFTLGLSLFAELMRYLFRTTWFKQQVAKIGFA